MYYSKTQYQSRLTFWKCISVTTFSYAQNNHRSFRKKVINKGQKQNTFTKYQGLYSGEIILNDAIHFTVYDKFKQYVSKQRQIEAKRKLKKCYTNLTLFQKTHTYQQMIYSILTNRLVAEFCTDLLNLIQQHF